MVYMYINEEKKRIHKKHQWILILYLYSCGKDGLKVNGA
jgi:hypothetical protein